MHWTVLGSAKVQQCLDLAQCLAETPDSAQIEGEATPSPRPIIGLCCSLCCQLAVRR